MPLGFGCRFGAQARWIQIVQSRFDIQLWSHKEKERKTNKKKNGTYDSG